MGAVAVVDSLPVTAGEALRLTKEFEAFAMQQPQVELETVHVLHAGIYSRTVRIPASVVITGALIKIPTVLTIFGNMRLTAGDKCIDVEEFATFKCPAGRKQIMYAKSDCLVQMSFATNAKTVEEAEDEFTNEGDLLMSRKKGVKR